MKSKKNIKKKKSIQMISPRNATTLSGHNKLESRSVITKDKECILQVFCKNLLIFFIDDEGNPFEVRISKKNFNEIIDFYNKPQKATNRKEYPSKTEFIG